MAMLQLCYAAEAEQSRAELDHLYLSSCLTASALLCSALFCSDFLAKKQSKVKNSTDLSSYDKTIF
jgi:hypothetical protein